jgi:hypothetical protein
MKYLIALFCFASVHAQQISEDPARPLIGKQGQIFAVKLDPKARSLQVTFVDKPLAVLEPGRVAVTAIVFGGQEGPRAVRVEEKEGELRIAQPVPEGPATSSKFVIKKAANPRRSRLKWALRAD